MAHMRAIAQSHTSTQHIVALLGLAIDPPNWRIVRQRSQQLHLRRRRGVAVDGLAADERGALEQTKSSVVAGHATSEALVLI